MSLRYAENGHDEHLRTSQAACIMHSCNSLTLPTMKHKAQQ